LLMANFTSNMQSYVPNGEVIVHFAGGGQHVTKLVNPHNFDMMFQHFSDNYPQWIGGEKDRYYGLPGYGRGIHADVMDIVTEGLVDILLPCQDATNGTDTAVEEFLELVCRLKGADPSVVGPLLCRLGSSLRGCRSVALSRMAVI